MWACCTGMVSTALCTSLSGAVGSADCFSISIWRGGSGGGLKCKCMSNRCHRKLNSNEYIVADWTNYRVRQLIHVASGASNQVKWVVYMCKLWGNCTHSYIHLHSGYNKNIQMSLYKVCQRISKITCMHQHAVKLWGPCRNSSKPMNSGIGHTEWPHKDLELSHFSSDKTQIAPISYSEVTWPPTFEYLPRPMQSGT